MSAPISRNKKRNTTLFTLTGSGTESTQSSVLPCHPRTRPLHSISTSRLFLLDKPSHKESSNLADAKNVVTQKSAKQLLESALTAVSPRLSAKSYYLETTLVTSRNPRPERAKLSNPEALADEFRPPSHNNKSLWFNLASIMMFSPAYENSWRADTTPVPGDNLVGSNHDILGSPHPATLHQGTQDLEKPLVSGNGVSCSIILAEPVIFLMGIDHDRNIRDSQGENAAALLRGSLRLNVTKAAKIKSVSLKFSGKAKTLWPEGIPPQKQDVVEETSLTSQVITFFNALHCSSENSYGDLCNYSFRDSRSTISSIRSPTSESPSSPQQGAFSLSGITNRVSKHNPGSSVFDAKRTSAPILQSKISSTGDHMLCSTQLKGYKVFHPGVYDYSFELPIDNNMPETTNLPLASVKWELEANVERAGTFKTNLSGKKEVPVIRSPSQDSLELVEPIAVSRNWENQLHYEIIISGKSFPIGTKIPIAFKLTPLAKVQVHKLKVILTESIDYFAKDKTVQRRDVKVSMLLLKKSAGKPLAKEFWPSEVKVLGGERTPGEREKRRALAMRRRELEALRNNTRPEPLPDIVENLLGDIDLGVEEWWGPTEIEMNVQIPTCETMERDRSKRLTHDCTWKSVHVHHWLKILIHLSRADPVDPSKRRHYEISVDSPISLLSCRATQANLSLPEYSGMSSNTLSTQPVCGCASTTRDSGGAIGSTSSIEFASSQNISCNPAVSNLARPAQAHLSTRIPPGAQRPIHLIRYPSFQPPPFDAEEPPPPITTPPPLYDHVIGTPSHDGLADYFTRLGEYEGELTDDEDSIISLRLNYLNAASRGHMADELSQLWI